MSYYDGQNVDVKYSLSTSSCMPLASLAPGPPSVIVSRESAIVCGMGGDDAQGSVLCTHLRIPFTIDTTNCHTCTFRSFITQTCAFEQAHRTELVGETVSAPRMWPLPNHHQAPSLYRGHRRSSFRALDDSEVIELRARYRTFFGAYYRTSLMCLAYAASIL